MMARGFLFIHSYTPNWFRDHLKHLEHLLERLKDIGHGKQFEDLARFLHRARTAGDNVGLSGIPFYCYGNVPSELKCLDEEDFSVYGTPLSSCCFVDVLEEVSSSGVHLQVKIPEFLKKGEHVSNSLKPFHLEFLFLNERDGQHTSNLVYTLYSTLVDELNFCDDVYVSVTENYNKSLTFVFLKKLYTLVIDEIDRILYTYTQMPESGRDDVGKSIDLDDSVAGIESIENAFSETFTSKRFMEACRTTDLLHDNKHVGHVGSQPYRVRSHFTLKEIEKKLKNLILKQVVTEILQKLRCEIFTEAELDHKVSDVIDEAEKVPDERNVLNMLFGIRELQTFFDMLSVGIFAIDVNSYEWRGKVAKSLFDGTQTNAELRKFIKSIEDACYAEIKRKIEDSDVNTKAKEIDADKGKVYFDTAEKQEKEEELNYLKDRFLKLLSKSEHGVHQHSIQVYTFEDFKKEKSMRECCRSLLSQHGSEMIRCWPGRICAPEKSVTEDVLVVCTKDEARCVPNNFKSPYDGKVYKVIKKIHEEDLEEERLLYEKEKNVIEKIRMPREKRIQVLNVMNKHSKQLMQRHSNLTVIKPSMFLSHKNGQDIETKPCIVFYCSSKGIIPIGENEFPKKLGEFDIDVREGIALPCGVQTYSDPLRMGCSIGRQGIQSAGSIGLFVQEVDTPQKYGFITCCHVLFGMSYTNVLRDFVRESCSSENKYFVVQQSDIDVQGSEEMMDVSNSASVPVPSARGYTASTTTSVSTGRECGLVRDIFHDKLRSVSLENNTLNLDVGVDAAYVEITRRNPSSSLFAERDELTRKGLSICDTPVGGVIEELSEVDERQILYKCGRTTCFTRGVFDPELYGGVKIYRDTNDPNQGFIELPNQYIVVSIADQGEHPFLDQGDSGAAVFLKKEDNLYCVGIGGAFLQLNPSHKMIRRTFVTPIKAVLSALRPKVKARNFITPLTVNKTACPSGC